MFGNTNVGTIAYDARIDTSKMRGDSAKADSIARSTGQSLEKNLGGAATRVGKSATYLTTRLTIASAALVVLGKSALNQTSDFQQARIAFDTMLGSATAGQKMLRELSEFAKRTPFNLPEVVQGAKSLLAYGIEAEKIVPTFNALGNIAAGVGRDKLPQLVLAYGQVRTATKLTGMELRQFTEAGVPLLDALAKQSGKTAAQIKDDMENGTAPSFEEVQKAIFGMSQDGGKFFNLMEKQSQTFAGRMSNIGDSVSQIIRGMLGVDVEGNVRPGSVFDKVTKAAEKLMKWLEANKEKIIGAIQSVFKFIENNGPAIAIFVGTILTAAFVTWAAAVIAATWPILALAAGVTALYLLFKKSEPVFWAVVSVLGAIATVMITKKALSAAKDGINLLKDAYTGVKDAMITAKDTFGKMKDVLVDTAKMVANAVKVGAEWVIQAARASAAWAWHMTKILATMAVKAPFMILHAADVGLAWIINAVRASFAWVTQELPKIVAGMAQTAFWATVHAAKASAVWVANATRSAVAWTVTELPKIVASFVVTSAAATYHALISSAAWVASATKSAVAWVITELPRIIAAFAVTSGAAVTHAAIASAAWVGAAVKSTASFQALSALVATPMVMPAIVVAAAVAALVVVLNKAKEVIATIERTNSAIDSAASSNMKTLQNAQAKRKSGEWTEEQYQRIVRSLASNAQGTNFWKGGPTWVGEKGPEIVNLPRGSQIIPNHEIGSMGTKIENNIGNIYLSNDVDADRFIRRLTQDQEIIGKGLTPQIKYN